MHCKNCGMLIDEHLGMADWNWNEIVKSDQLERQPYIQENAQDSEGFSA